MVGHTPTAKWCKYRDADRCILTLLGEFHARPMSEYYLLVESLIISKRTIDLLMYCTCSYALCLNRDISVWFSTV